MLKGRYVNRADVVGGFQSLKGDLREGYVSAVPSLHSTQSSDARKLFW